MLPHPPPIYVQSPILHLQFYVNGAETWKKKKINPVKWQRRHQCVWICFLLPDALQSSVGRATSCINQIEPDNCLIHLEPIFVPESWKQQPLAFLQPRLKNCKCLQKKERRRKKKKWRVAAGLLLLPLCLMCATTTAYIKNPAYLIWAVALGISANSEGAEL